MRVIALVVGLLLPLGSVSADCGARCFVPQAQVQYQAVQQFQVVPKVQAQLVYPPARAYVAPAAAFVPIQVQKQVKVQRQVVPVKAQQQAPAYVAPAATAIPSVQQNVIVNPDNQPQRRGLFPRLFNRRK